MVFENAFDFRITKAEGNCMEIANIDDNFTLICGNLRVECGPQNCGWSGIHHEQRTIQSLG